MQNFKQQAAKLLAAHFNELSYGEILETLEQPQDSKMGDLAFPCFRLAKTRRQAPPLIAKEGADAISAETSAAGKFEKVEAVSGFINFFADKPALARDVLSQIKEQGNNYGRSETGANRVVVIDYSSPNICKPFHIGHLYSTFIGAALYNIYGFLGYKPFGINFLGDWGTQFGKMIVGYKRYSSKQAVDEGGVFELSRAYAKFHEDADEDPTLDDEARSWLVKMQQGDEEALNLWRWFKDISLEDYNKAYKRMGVSFDSYNGESFYNDKMEAVVDELKEKNLLVESDGAMIVNLETYKMPPCLILRRDGGTLYPTRDIASGIYRFRTYNFHKALYVTDASQRLHFAQWFKVCELMGYDFAKDLVHIPYGYCSLESGPMSTRKGNFVSASDLFDEGKARMRAIIDEKNPNLPNKDDIAEAVSMGAVKFADLYNSRIKDVVFNWDRVLSAEGETGPYVQYTHARACGVLENAASLTDADSAEPDYSTLNDGESQELLKLLSGYQAAATEAADKYEPFLVARYVMSLAQGFNRFYNSKKILSAPAPERAARLEAVRAAQTVLRSGLALLGIKSPEKM